MDRTEPLLWLPYEVRRIRTEPPPNRALVIEAEISNPTDEPFAVLEMWCRAALDPGGRIHTTFIELLPNDIGRAYFEARAALFARFVIPISSALLQEVERQRTAEVSLWIESRIRVAPIVLAGGASVSVLGTPREVGLSARSTTKTGIHHTIARSEWIDFLKQWRWSEIELFELIGSGDDHPASRRMYELLETAQDRLRNGDFEGTFQACRNVVEGLAKDSVPEGDLKKGFDALLSTIDSQDLRTRVNTLLKAIKDLSQLAAHEHRPRPVIRRAEALLILRVTLSAVEYLTAPRR